MSYSIIILKRAQKFLQKQNQQDRQIILSKIYELPQGDVKKLSSFKSLYRLRIGDFRVIFDKNDERLVIMVIDIGNRGDVYKHL